MADQENRDADTEVDVDTELEAGTDEEVEVEGFNNINTTRSNIKGIASTPRLGGVPGGTASGIAIKEQGIK